MGLNRLVMIPIMNVSNQYVKYTDGIDTPSFGHGNNVDWMVQVFDLLNGYTFLSRLLI